MAHGWLLATKTTLAESQTVSRTAPFADPALQRQELGVCALVLLVLVQGERRDPEYSLLWASQLSHTEHARHDQVMDWFCTLGLLEAGAPHFCLTGRGRATLMALRMARTASAAITGRFGKPASKAGRRRLTRWPRLQC